MVLVDFFFPELCLFCVCVCLSVWAESDSICERRYIYQPRVKMNRMQEIGKALQQYSCVNEWFSRFAAS